MSSVPDNPLSALSDEQLFEAQLTLYLACARTKSVLRTKHRTRICGLAQILNVEALNRGTPNPSPPYSA